jgi:hypothetical protein
MADRVLRGSRLGAVSYETDRNHDLAPRQCRLHGSISKLVDGTEPEQKKIKPPRTHWDMLLERRSVADLEVLLNERLELLAERRREIA